jgi:hypothetical protein
MSIILEVFPSYLDHIEIIINLLVLVEYNHIAYKRYSIILKNVMIVYRSYLSLISGIMILHN